MRRLSTLLLAAVLLLASAACLTAQQAPSDTPARDLMASALTDVSRCRTFDRAGVQSAWDKMGQAFAILLARPGRWAEPENRLRGDVEWLLRVGADRAKTFGRIDSITAVIVRSRGEASAMLIQPVILGTFRPECLRGNTTQILLWRSGDQVLHQTFVYGLDRPADWSAPFKREITQVTVWRWENEMVLGIGSAVERDGVARHPEYLVLRQDKGRWTVRQRIASDEEGYPAWAADVDGDQADEVVLRTTTWPEAAPFAETRSSPHVYFDTTYERRGEVFERARRARVDSPYAVLCDFALALRRGDEAAAAGLAATPDVLAQAQSAALDIAVELRAVSAWGFRVEVEADGKPFIARFAKREGAWRVSSIEAKRILPAMRH